MKEIVIQLAEQASPFVVQQACQGNNRKALNVARVLGDPELRSAVLHDVVQDFRVVESLQQVDPLARSLILRTEARLGRRLGRDRLQALLAGYRKQLQAKTQAFKVKSFLAGYGSPV